MIFGDGPRARQRLMWLSTGSALLVACVLLLGQRWHSERAALLDHLAVDAALVGGNAGAAVAFNDDQAAAEMLAALEHSRVVVEAALYRRDGSRLASFRQASTPAGLLPAAAPAAGGQIGWREARVAAPVILDGRDVGTIALRATLVPVYRSLAEFFAGLLGIMATAAGLAALASRNLRERMAAAERALERLALVDRPTGLPNRYAFERMVEQTVARHRREGRGSALLYADVDGFKKINDMFGHHVGDVALEQIGNRLRQGLRAMDVVARLGGDEFGILLTDIQAPGDAARIANTLIESVSRPLDTGGRPAHVGLSVGIAMIPADGRTADELLQRADLAMYHAKQSGRNNSQFFSDHIGSSVRFRMDIEAALRTGLAENQFHLVYQPQVDAHSGRLCGLEALVRWRHPERGVVAPLDFMSVAEESGLIVDLGRRVLALACADIVQLRQAGCRVPPVAINVSARQLSRSRLGEDVVAALVRHGLEPADLELEITESVVMDRSDDTEPILAELAAAGLTIAIDDFGTGYSSLAFLKRLAVSKLKIDNSFVRDLPGDAESAAVVAAIIDLAHALKLRVIAEGAETAAQADCLRALGCDLLQGYLAGRPMEREALAAYLSGQA